MSVETYGGKAGRAFTAQLRLQGGVASDTLTGNLTLTGRSANFMSLDGGSSHRDITLPVVNARSASPLFWFSNRGATHNLVVKNSAGSTIATLTPGETTLVAWDGTSWRSFMVQDLDLGTLTVATELVIETLFTLEDDGVISIGDDGDVTITHSGTSVTIAGRVHFTAGRQLTRSDTIYDFLLAPSATLELPWAKDVHNGATGDYTADTTGGIYTLATVAVSEAEAGQITHGNQLTINLSQTPIVRFRVKFSPAGAAFTADERLVIGVCSDHTNAEDSLDNVTTNAWFRIEGANLDILWESDDGSADDDDNDSGINIVKDAWTEFEIDFTSLAAVKFRVDGVDASGTCDLSGLSANTMVQPIVCIQRDAGTEINSLATDVVQIVQTRL